METLSSTDNFEMIIYKYRPWETPYKSILEENQLWFPSVRTLRINDSNELTNYPNFTLLPDNDKYALLYDSLDLNRPTLNKDLKIRIVNKKFEEGRLNNWKDFESIGREISELISSKIGICSFSKNKNILNQWKEYAAEFKGICVGFEFELIHNTIGGHFGPINYNACKHPSAVYNSPNDNMENLFNLDCTKLENFIEENEFRYNKIDSTLKEHEFYKDKGHTIPPDAFKEIIIGEKNNERDNIINLCRTKFPSAILFEALLNYDKVEIVPL